MKSIGQIVWPSERRKAIELYLGFLLDVVKPLELDFQEGPDPVKRVEQFLGGSIEMLADQRDLERWWGGLMERGNLRSPQNREEVVARIAITILSAESMVTEHYEESLSFFFELLYALGREAQDSALKRMDEYFEFSE